MNSQAIAAASNAALASTGIPEGFEELASPRETLVDVYFGNEKVGEALAITGPGTLRFKSPAGLLSMIPRIGQSPALSAAAAGELPTNSQAVCAVSNRGDCGALSPEILGIIYDESRFRVDLFVNPRFVLTSHSAPQGYLPIPTSSLSLTNALGLTASGAVGGSTAYNVQNRTIVGLRNARLRANTSVASDLGLVVDDFVGEVDRKNLRYSAGLFWAPGSDFIGQRRIIGAGIGTQFDTWADQDGLRGTPLIVFLSQPGRVELLVDGRLISSRSYPAGNNDVDTSALSDGSYTVVIRIHQPNGTTREERRFFVKNAQVPPSGHPVFYAYGGLLANTRRHQPVSVSGTFYFQAGTAWRLSNAIALDVAAIGTQDKAILQAGGWLIKGPVRLRAAGLASTAGDAGGLVQLSTAGHGPLNLSFDLRRIWSHDGRPLIPMSIQPSSFDRDPATGVQLAVGSYTQATASLGLRIGDGFLSVIGSYRKDRSRKADYTVGPSVSWPLVTRNRVQVVLDLSAQRTRSTTAGFAGFRLLFTSGRMSMLSTIGRGFQNERSGPDSSLSRAVSNFTAQYSHETEDRLLLNLEGGVDRNIDTSTLHAGGTVDSRFGHLRADVLHNLEGNGGTQYNIAFQSGIALGADASVLGSRDLDQSALLVSVGGDAPGSEFNVLINDIDRGRVKIGQRLSLFVPAYRTYKVRVVPAAAYAVSYDAAPREVTLYPGNVQSLAWRAQSYFTVFGQAVAADGSPIADAMVQSAKEVAQTDSNGYFQIDMARGGAITIAKPGRPACRVKLGDVAVRNDFASVGKVLCQ